ncbi:MAG TPA: biopolymer transporter ExbD [bacterium]|nr:biopolymer transporter ExbD [bacterium]
MLKKRERESLITQINITPLTDVMLVLLIIFMVATPFIMQGNIDINLPSARAPAEAVQDKNIIISITSDGFIYLNGRQAKDDESLLSGIREEMSKTGVTTVIIEGDRMAFHGEMVKAMSLAREAGAEKLAISTIPDEEKERLIKR